MTSWMRSSSRTSVPPVVNDAALADALRAAWTDQMGADAVVDIPTKGMGAEDFPFFTQATFRAWAVGGTAAGSLRSRGGRR